ncbi:MULTISPECIES: hypothetical protein [unclassified Pseudomonas]|uniref:hypothetical protein n=1 Tax=unclassified Pseudomonas TaxID=196821 RepID=UPI00131B0D14|nr:MULTISPECIES: hypothetical protein [unclassified Pseudomonas]
MTLRELPPAGMNPNPRFNHPVLRKVLMVTNQDIGSAETPDAADQIGLQLKGYLEVLLDTEFITREEFEDFMPAIDYAVSQWLPIEERPTGQPPSGRSR